jgi:hypothetical protein
MFGWERRKTMLQEIHEEICATHASGHRWLGKYRGWSISR